MRRLCVMALLLLLTVWVRPAHAQLFGRRTRANPAQRVPELIVTLKTASEERKRVRAAEELRDFDARTYSEIVPVLIDALKSDPKQAVRMEALSTLAKLRPVSQAAGQAIEKAAAGDESWRIRLHARSVLVGYRLAGYSSGGADKTDVASTSGSLPRPRRVTTAEPPLADPPARTSEPPLLPAPPIVEQPAGSGPDLPAVPFPPPTSGRPALLAPPAPAPTVAPGPLLPTPSSETGGPTLPTR